MDEQASAEEIAGRALADARPLLDLAGASRDERNRLLEDLYPRLRQIAARILREDAPVLTLAPTELANEAVLRILRSDTLACNDRAHLLSLCARIMRHVIVDSARRVRAAKRRHVAVTTSWLRSEVAAESVDTEDLDALLTEFEQISPARARVVELRFFVGLSIPEIATALELSESTVKRQWQAARAWLVQRLSGRDSGTTTSG